MTEQATNVLDTQNEYTSIRVHKSVIKKLDRLGRFKESYGAVVERLVSERLGLLPNSSDGAPALEDPFELTIDNLDRWLLDPYKKQRQVLEDAKKKVRDNETSIDSKVLMNC